MICYRISWRFDPKRWLPNSGIWLARFLGILGLQCLPDSSQIPAHQWLFWCLCIALCPLLCPFRLSAGLFREEAFGKVPVMCGEDSAWGSVGVVAVRKSSGRLNNKFPERMKKIVRLEAQSRQEQFGEVEFRCRLDSGLSFLDLRLLGFQLWKLMRAQRNTSPLWWVVS